MSWKADILKILEAKWLHDYISVLYPGLGKIVHFLISKHFWMQTHFIVSCFIFDYRLRQLVVLIYISLVMYFDWLFNFIHLSSRFPCSFLPSTIYFAVTLKKCFTFGFRWIWLVSRLVYVPATFLQCTMHSTVTQ